MGKTESQLVISCHQMKFPVPGLNYTKWGCWPKEPHRNPQTTQAVAKAIGRSLQTDCKASLMAAPTQLIEHGEVELVPT